jgi:hypothetical protein
MEKTKEFVKKMDRRLLVAGVTLLILLGTVIPIGFLFEGKRQFADCKRELARAWDTTDISKNNDYPSCESTNTSSTQEQKPIISKNIEEGRKDCCL